MSRPNVIPQGQIVVGRVIHDVPLEEVPMSRTTIYYAEPRDGWRAGDALGVWYWRRWQFARFTAALHSLEPRNAKRPGR